MPGGAVVYSHNAIGDTSMSSPPLSLTAGTYNLQIWGNPNELSWKSPYDFIVNYVPGVNSINAFNNNDAPSLCIFPNPATSTLTIKASPKAEIEIFNIEGQQVQTFITTGVKTKIDVSDFPSGVFIIKAVTESGIGVSKFVKE